MLLCGLLATVLEYDSPAFVEFGDTEPVTLLFEAQYGGPGHAFALLVDDGSVDFVLCEALTGTCDERTFLRRWDDIDGRTVLYLDSGLQNGVFYIAKLFPRRLPTQLYFTVFLRASAASQAVVKPNNDSGPIIPNRLQEPAFLADQNDQALKDFVFGTYRQLNVDQDQISRQTPAVTAGHAKSLHPVLFTRSYLEGACYETAADAFFEVLYNKPVQPKYLVVGHPRCLQCDKTAPRAVFVSYIRTSRDGLQLRELAPFLYDLNGPVEQVFNLATHGLDEQDEIVRIKVSYTGYGEHVCAYYFGLLGDPLSNSIFQQYSSD